MSVNWKFFPVMLFQNIFIVNFQKKFLNFKAGFENLVTVRHFPILDIASAIGWMTFIYMEPCLTPLLERFVFIYVLFTHYDSPCSHTHTPTFLQNLNDFDSFLMKASLGAFIGLFHGLPFSLSGKK